VLLPSVQTGRSGSSFQAIFASASEEGISREGAKSPDATGQGMTAQDAKTDAGAGSQKEPSQPAAQSDISARATATVSSVDLQKAPTKNLSRGQEVGQRQGEAVSGSFGTVKEKSSHSTSSETNVRTTSPATIASSVTVPAEQISRSYNIFQSMLAVAPTVAISENGQLSSDAKAQAFASTSSRTASIPEMSEGITAATGSIRRVGISVSDTTTRADLGGVAGSRDQTRSLLVPFPASAPANVPPSSTGQQGNSANSQSILDSSQASGNGMSQSSGVAKAESSSTTLTAATTRTSTPTSIGIPSALPPATDGWSHSTFQMALVSASNQTIPASSATDSGAMTYIVANGISKSPVTTSNSVPSEFATTNQSYATAQTELVSAPEKAIVAGSSVLPGADISASANAPSRIASPQEQRQPASVTNNIVAHTSATFPRADRENSATVRVAKTQDNWSSDSASDSSSASGSTARSESLDGTSDVRAPKATQEIPQQRVDSSPLPAISMPIEPVIKEVNLAVTMPGSVNQEPALSGIPTGMPDFQSDTPAQSTGIALQAPVDLSIAVVVPRSGDGTQPVGKPVQKNVSDGALKNSAPVNTANAGTGKTTASSNGAHDASSHDAQNNGQSSQDSQSQAAATAPKTPDTSASQQQMQAAVVHAVSHEVAAPHRAPDGSDNAARTAEQRDVTASIHAEGEGTVTSGINTAKLIQTMSETEMRVGMSSAEFGNISIRTSISQQQMVAQISVDHSDLSQAISAHVSSVQTKLGDDHGIHALIEVNNQGASPFGDSGHSSQREQRAFVSSARAESTIGATEIDNGMNLGALVSVGNEQRLDIRA
jgi:hypothetical protein